jgi:glycogen synthase
MMRRGMLKDYSWRVSASEYAALYQRLLDAARWLHPSAQKDQ